MSKLDEQAEKLAKLNGDLKYYRRVRAGLRVDLQAQDQVIKELEAYRETVTFNLKLSATGAQPVE